VSPEDDKQKSPKTSVPTVLSDNKAASFSVSLHVFPFAGALFVPQCIYKIK
jgi:hypothetical protein